MMIRFTSAEAAPTFDHPLEMLHACHDRILRQCDLLERLAAHLASNGCDQQARQAAQAILRYFDTAGQFHHLDEEEDLFPALRRSAGSDQAQLEMLLGRLLSEHVVMLASWNALRPVLLQLADGVDTPLPATLTAKFIDSYTGHIAVEERDLLPMAARLLNPQQAALIGKRMAERRGANFISAN
jgi:hemerythrin-like domain-containing protein